MTTILKVSHPAYDALVASTVDQIITLGIQKGGEYSGDRNRVENFVRNAINLQLEPEQVWAVYAGKHWDAIIQYVNDLASGKSRPRTESITGRIDDLIVYALLMKSMMVARTCVDNNYELIVGKEDTTSARDEKKSDEERPNLMEEAMKSSLAEMPDRYKKSQPPIPEFLTEAVEHGLLEEVVDVTPETELVDAVAKTRRRV